MIKMSPQFNEEEIKRGDAVSVQIVKTDVVVAFTEENPYKINALVTFVSPLKIGIAYVSSKGSEPVKLVIDINSIVDKVYVITKLSEGEQSTWKA